jgi:hypothetical protein
MAATYHRRTGFAITDAEPVAGKSFAAVQRSGFLALDIRSWRGGR